MTEMIFQIEEDPEGLNVDPLVWNTWRVTCNALTGEVQVYYNEMDEPVQTLATFMELRSDSKYRVSYGDGSGGNRYDGLYDYIIIETGGAYSPVDLPLSKILPG